MINARVSVPTPINESILTYAPGSPEKQALKNQLDQFASSQIEIPMIIGGRNVMTGNLGQCILPHDHRKAVATYHKGDRFRTASHTSRRRSTRRLGEYAVGGEVRDFPQGSRVTRWSLSTDPQRRHDAEPE